MKSLLLLWFFSSHYALISLSTLQVREPNHTTNCIVDPKLCLTNRSEFLHTSITSVFELQFPGSLVSPPHHTTSVLKHQIRSISVCEPLIRLAWSFNRNQTGNVKETQGPVQSPNLLYGGGAQSLYIQNPWAHNNKCQT